MTISIGHNKTLTNVSGIQLPIGVDWMVGRSLAKSAVGLWCNDAARNLPVSGCRNTGKVGHAAISANAMELNLEDDFEQTSSFASDHVSGLEY